MNINAYSVLGIDACKNGWIVAEIKENQLQVDMFESFQSLIETYENSKLIIIDIPIGIPESKEEAENRPEPEVRILLPKKSSSVFTVPCRIAAEKSSYEKANKTNKQILGKGLSKQSYYVMSKALEVNQFIEKNIEYTDRIIESHPELQFAQFQESKLPVIASKKTSTGLKKREDLLAEILNTHFKISFDFKSIYLNTKYPDDVLDAICLSAAAGISLKNGLITVPKYPMKNSQGIPMKMSYCEI